MSAFKSAVARDVRAAFINTKEFGDVHTIDGRAVPCVVDGDLLKELPGGVRGQVDGVFLEEFVVFVATSDLDPPPVKDQRVRFDGSFYFVKDVWENMGVLQITFMAHET